MVLSDNGLRFFPQIRWFLIIVLIRNDFLDAGSNWLVVWHMNVIFPYTCIGNVIIPTDFHSIIFQRGRLKPPTR